ncbi:hypothetical protein H5410_050399 [Solanum commersonii]|uniref:Uncharacterized protein n=1 Tax=Solanum commersonii TaxID=4109 RepID=A0A9J5WXH6_SOLCO|nr:hypothetical protein H5410_050399 [Solanum commersonii]
MFILSGKDSLNSEAQSVVKPATEAPTEDLDVVSQPDPISSTMYERIFYGDLPEGKGTESNILVAAEELVVQSLALLKRDMQSPFLEGECRSLEQAPQRVQPVFDQTPEIVGVTSEVDDEEVSLSWLEKVLEEHMLQLYLPLILQELILHLRLEVLTNLLNLTRKGREKERGRLLNPKGGERQKAQDSTKLSKKPPTKRVRITTKAASKSKSIKGPGLTAQRPDEEKVLTREEHIAELKRDKVLNGRVFDYEILIKSGMCTCYDFVSLQSWEHLFECPVSYLHEPEVREFYYKMELLDDGVI